MKQLGHAKQKMLGAGIVLGSIVLTLAALEAAARAYEHDFHFDSQLARDTELLHWSSPTTYDPALGWIPKPGHTLGPEGETIDILPSTVRSNGSRDALPERPAVLAIGDSFTFGYEVSNDETWPALLERLTGVRVINGGVFGYGVDQAALRTNQLIDRFAPDMVIFALIADDIERTQLSKRDGAKKPYFLVQRDGGLVLRGVPVPPPESYRSGSLIDEIKTEAGRSLLFDRFMRRTFPEWWLIGDANSKVHDNGDAVACGIIRQTAGGAKRAGMGFLVLLEYTKEDVFDASALAHLSRLKHCLEADHIQIVDPDARLRAIHACDPAQFDSLYSHKWGHMTKAGNRLTAMAVMPFVRETLNLPPAKSPAAPARNAERVC